MVFQIGMDGHRLRLPRLLGGAGADIAANGAKLRVGNAHKAVHKVQRDIALQAFSLDVEVRHSDGITGAKEPCKAVFLLGHRPDIPVDVFHPVLMFATGKDTHYLDRCFRLAVTNGCDKES